MNGPLRDGFIILRGITIRVYFTAIFKIIIAELELSNSLVALKYMWHTQMVIIMQQL
jgi:hypothetical protein